MIKLARASRLSCGRSSSDEWRETTHTGESQEKGTQARKIAFEVGDVMEQVQTSGEKRNTEINHKKKMIKRAG